jgi:hypothetical protein
MQDVFTTQISADDPLWTAECNHWEDLRDLFRDPVAWVAGHAGMELNAKHFIHIQLDTLAIQGDQGPKVVVQGVDRTGVISVRNHGMPFFRLPEPELFQHHELELTILENKGLGFAHFQLPPADQVHEVILWMCQTQNAMAWALNTWGGPVTIRYEQGDTRPVRDKEVTFYSGPSLQIVLEGGCSGGAKPSGDQEDDGDPAPAGPNPCVICPGRVVAIPGGNWGFTLDLVIFKCYRPK